MALGYLLEEDPVFYKKKSGKNAGKKCFVDKHESVYTIHGVELEWPYGAENWHDKSGSIIITEGEKDVDVLHHMGYSATTAGGASTSWKKELVEKLKNFDTFYFFRDNDTPGAKSLLSSLKVFTAARQNGTLAATTKLIWVKIPGHSTPETMSLTEKGGLDVRDWLKENSDSEFKALLETEVEVTAELFESLDLEHKTERKRINDEKKRAAGLPVEGDSEEPPQPPVKEGDEVYDFSNEPLAALNDNGNAERFLHRFNGMAYYCVEDVQHPWRTWDGTRFVEDKNSSIVTNMCDEIPLMIQREIYYRKKHMNASEDDEKYINSMYAFATSSGNKGRIENMLWRVAKKDHVRCGSEDFHRNIWLLNVKNGTIDLETQTFREHRKEDMLCQMADVVYDPKATCPRWEAFMNEIMINRKSLVKFWQRSLGYGLTGSTREEKYWIMYGSGGNGKGIIAKVIDNLMGDYSISSETKTFMANHQTAASSGIARMQGARFVWASETNEDDIFDEALLKNISSNDRVAARFNGKDQIEFDPTHKIFFLTNNEPEIKGKDDGIWRRTQVCPFDLKVTDKGKDKYLYRDLMAEASGILNWMLEGVREYLEIDDLAPPEEILKKTMKYREDQDPYGVFFDQYCVLDSQKEIRSDHLFNSFYNWQKTIAKFQKPFSNVGFGRLMKKRKFESRKSNSKSYYKGLRLKTEAELKADEIIQPKQGELLKDIQNVNPPGV